MIPRCSYCRRRLVWWQLLLAAAFYWLPSLRELLNERPSQLGCQRRHCIAAQDVTRAIIAAQDVPCTWRLDEDAEL